MAEDIDRGDEKAEIQIHNGVQRNVRLSLGEANPEPLPPVGVKEPGRQDYNYAHHIALVPVGPPPPSEQCGLTVAVST